MKKGPKGFGGGSVFRTPYIPVPINKISSIGVNKTVSIVTVDRVQKANSLESGKLDNTKKSFLCPSKVKALLEIAYFRVQYSNTFARLCKIPWIILVSCKDGKGLRLASDVGHDFNIEIKEAFKTRSEAITAGKEYLKWWHK